MIRPALAAAAVLVALAPALPANAEPAPQSYMAERAAIQPKSADAVLARPLLRVPFSCGENWSGASRSGHSPSYYSLDFNWGSGRDDLGKPVKSSAAGTVVRSAYDAGGYGNYIEIAHGDGWRTLYAHLQNRAVAVNDRVTNSTQIGRVGDTGNVTGPHLHYEQIHNGAVVAAKFGTSTWATYPGPDTYARIRDC
ncbi:M23 family metallopeptidase [Kribbella sandramycini]|uniref:M23 family metallopeptidase n=1 Tax=Kribbella sandramycini TaxID=60450 RepID=A0A7Y4L2Z0_9ACTN|nr:M23 family metallopeptidase [Kribbella sandramycini]MBB6564839.1 murein DD-endopeptidase MepM/ murein hydrolase activator NlpD [Kribbella sandramycini]NOL42537.1 M23 family metallopeptidase [Kribbella sandramycini]